MFTTLLNFCSNDLSAFYFDIRKDTIYCDNIASIKRRAARTLLDLIFNHLVRWLAPTLVFTCEEAWKARGNFNSIHLEEFLSVNNKYKNYDIKNKWDIIKNIRKVITGALEKKRAEKYIGSSLEAHAKIYLSSQIIPNIKNVDFGEVAITSSFEILIYNENNNAFIMEDIKEVAVDIEKSSGKKCHRCWKFDHKLNLNNICNRCKDAIPK